MQERKTRRKQQRGLGCSDSARSIESDCCPIALLWRFFVVEARIFVGYVVPLAVSHHHDRTKDPRIHPRPHSPRLDHRRRPITRFVFLRVINSFWSVFWSKSFEFLNTRGRISSSLVKTDPLHSAHALLNSPPCRPSTCSFDPIMRSQAAAHNNEALASRLVPTGNPCGF